MDQAVGDAEDAGAVQLTADIVSAYVSNNPIRPADFLALIGQVHTALGQLSAPAAVPEDTIERATPTQIRKSITPDGLISFIDGKPYKTLKRHLSTRGLDFETYRARYGLPADYPTVAAGYSAKRSALAQEFGLGQQRRKAAPVAEPPPAAAAAPRRGRPRKTPAAIA